MSSTKTVFTLTVDQDWSYYDLKEGSVLKFLGKSYEKDKQRTIHVFQLIGNPVEDEPKLEVVFT